MRNIFNLLLTFLMVSYGYSQCSSWETIYADSYEYTTPIPGVIPSTVYGNTPATYAGGIHSGNRHAYLNFVNGYTGPAIDTIYPVCVGSDIQISFWFKDTWGGDNDFTINLYDANDLLLNTQTFTISSNNTWNQYISPELNMTTTELRFELVNNGTTGGNDLAMDDFVFNVCSIQESIDLLLCSSSSILNLFDEFSINMPLGGTWSGPSALANGDQGTFDPTVNLGGSYTYNFTSQFPCPTPFGSVQVGNVSNLNLGNDTTICDGANITLDAGTGYDFYSWSNGSSDQTINVNQNDTFIVVVGATGSNLIVNGDFELGDSDFTSDYINATGGGWGPLSNPGEYLVTTSPSLGHNNFSTCGDHTSGSGNMFVANGSSVANTSAWCQTVNVDPNTEYLFSTWVTNALNDANVAQLQFFVDDVQIGPVFTTSTSGCDWLEFNASWNSGIATTANLCIKNQNVGGGGNDFALDDISFRPVCSLTDSIIVEIDSISVIASDDQTFCANEIDSITALANYANSTYQWNNGFNVNTILPDTSGQYIVTATSPNQCTDSDTVLVNIIPMNWDIDTIITGPAHCGINDGFVSLFLNGNPSPPSYNWTGPGANNPSFVNASVWDDLSAGWYYATITVDGCSRYDSVEVIIEDGPQAMASANPSNGIAPLEVTFTNSSTNATDFYWDFGNTNTSTTNDLSDQDQTYTEVGTYTIMLVANSSNCSDTTYLTVIVEEPPVDPIDAIVNIPNVFTPNSDGVNDYFEVDIQNVNAFQVEIRNRWGNVMYKSEDVLFQWDGTTKGAPANSGVYFYYINIKDQQDKEHVYNGTVHLKR